MNEIMGFSPQLKARTWKDPIREFLRQRIQRIQAVEYPVIGVDISSWQGAIDWSIMGQKVYFVIIRAGRGNQDRDTLYAANLKGAHDQGRGVAIYWYMIPRTQSNFKTIVDALAPIYNDSGSQLPCMFDCEDNGGFDKTFYTGWCQKAVAYFQDKTGKDPMIYTSPGFWNGSTYRSDWPKTLKLDVAHWTTADEPLIPNDWGAIANPKPWTFWQHSSKGDGKAYGASSTSIDLQRFHWSLGEFNATFKMSLKPLGEVPPPPPPPPEKTLEQRVSALEYAAREHGWNV